MLKVNLQLAAIEAVKKATDRDYSCTLLISEDGEIIISDYRYRYAVIIGQHLNPLVNDDDLQSIVSSFFFKGEYLPREFSPDKWERGYRTKLRPAIKRMGLPVEEVENALLTFRWLQDHC